MKVKPCSNRRLLKPCVLEGHTYQLDTYIGCEHRCSYCYALNEAETDWAEEILIHPNLGDRLDHELSELEPQSIYIGWNCDPYQPAEKSQQQTRQALELLGKRGFSVCILTKSDLVTRDIDLLASMQSSSAGVSIAFQDEQVRGLFEPKAPENARRIEALKALKDSGIETYALICPVMPFITDVELLAERVAPYTDTIWVYALNMEAEGNRNWQNVRGILDRNFSGMSKRYRQIAFSGNHPYWTELRQNLESLKQEKYLNLRVKL